MLPAQLKGAKCGVHDGRTFTLNPLEATLVSPVDYEVSLPVDMTWKYNQLLIEDVKVIYRGVVEKLEEGKYRIRYRFGPSSVPRRYWFYQFVLPERANVLAETTPGYKFSTREDSKVLIEYELKDVLNTEIKLEIVYSIGS